MTDWNELLDEPDSEKISGIDWNSLVKEEPSLRRELTDLSAFDKERRKKKLFEQEIIDPDRKTGIKEIMLSSLVRDPESKIDIYAKGRGISPERYSVVDDNIVFLDPKDQLRREKSKGIIPTVKRYGLETLSDPATIGGAIGMATGTATGGPVAGLGGAIAGAAAGENLRQQIAASISGEELSVEEKRKQIITAGGLEAAGLGIGKGLSKGIGMAVRGLRGPASKATKRLSDAITEFKRKVPGADYLYGSKEYIEKAVEEQTRAKKFGIELNLGQTTGDQRVIAALKDISSRSTTTESTSIASQIQQKQIEESIPEFYRKMFPKAMVVPQSSGIASDKGFQLRKAAKDAVKGLNILRARITKPFYDAAFKESPEINVNGLIEMIQDSSKEFVPYQKKSIRNILKSLTSKDGKFKETIPIEKLNNLKIHIDDLLYSKEAVKSVDKAVRPVLKKINDEIIERMDSVSSQYKNARLIHSLLTVPGKISAESRRLSQQGLVPLSKFNETELAAATTFLFANKKMNPAVLRHVKTKILEQPDGKKIWDDSVSQYLEYVITNSKNDAAGSKSNIGTYMLDAVFGTSHKQAIWKTALSKEQYKTFKDYFKVMQRIGLTFSPSDLKIKTSSAAESAKEEFTSQWIKLPQPFVSKESILARMMNRLLFNKGYEALSKLLLDPDSGKILNRIMKLKNREERLETFLKFAVPATVLHE